MTLKWLKKFWSIHGIRLFFGTLALAFAVAFMYSPNEQLQGSGLTIAIGLAMECYRQARGGTAEPDKPEPPKE